MGGSLFFASTATAKGDPSRGKGPCVAMGIETNGEGPSGAVDKPWAKDALLHRPLYAFDLPAPLLSSLQLRSIDVARDEEEQDEEEDSTANGQRERVPSSSRCSVCPNTPSFSSASEKRLHLASDWHRYNAGLGKQGRREETLAREAFEKVVEELSTAESDIESDANEERERVATDVVATLLKRLTFQSRNEAQDTTSDEEGGNPDADTATTVAREPHLWFVTRAAAEHTIPQTQFGLIRQLFRHSGKDKATDDGYREELLQMQPGPINPSMLKKAKKLKGAKAVEEAASTLGVVFMDASGELGEDSDQDESEDEASAPINDTESATTEAPSLASLSATPSVSFGPLRTWTLILFGGGDFAAVVVALNPYQRVLSKRKGSVEHQLVVVARKQFHRYTTRRKQGGAQSAQDASGRFAKSAGANLRRYGEQQLATEIRELLDLPQWRSAIQSSERVWIRAGLRSSRGVLWSWNTAAGAATQQESPLEEMRNRNLVQTLPIPTRKPTVGECLRCFAQLTRVRVRHETDEQMQQRDDAYRQQLQRLQKARQDQRQRQKERAQRRQAKEALANQKASKDASATKLDPVQQIHRERFARMIEMIRKGRLESFVRHLERYENELLRPNGDWETQPEQEPDDVDESVELANRRINARLPHWWRWTDARAKGALLQGSADSVASQLDILATRPRLVPSTLLQVAAEGGHESVVKYLLVDRKCDPTTKVDSPPYAEDGTIAAAAQQSSSAVLDRFPHRTAYDLCSTREARDVFRRLMAAEPTMCNWSGMEAGGARVPKALTEEMQEVRNKEEQVRDRRQLIRDRVRKQEQEEASKKAHTITEDDRQAAATATAAKGKSNVAGAGSETSASNRLGGNNTAPRALQRQRDDAAGLTPEMRARIEREKRARAAEARFKALQKGGE